MAETREKAPAGRGGERGILLVICTAIFFSVLNGTMVNVALPAIGEDLGVDPARLGWVLTAYLLVFGVAVPFYGRLADALGARRLFVLGLAVYALSSLLCAVAGSYAMLLGARVLQALGAAAIPGLGMAILSSVFPRERRGSALGLVSATIGTGSAIGPTTGGIISDFADWHAMFLLVALSGLLIPVALRLLPPGERREGERIDLLGGALVALTVGGALLAATEAARGDVLAPVVLGAVVVSVVAAVLLVLRQRLATSPFVPRDLLANRRFLGLVGVSFASMTANLATFVSIPLLLTGPYRLPTSLVGLVLLPNALALAVLGPIAGRIVDRIGGRLPIRAGLLTILAVVFTFSAWGAGAPVWAIALLAGVQGVGFAFMNAPLTTMVSLAVGSERQATALSLNSMAFFLGGGFGAAFLTAVLTLRASATDALNPLYTGGYVRFSDSFLVFCVPLILALLLSFPGLRAERAVEEARTGPTSEPAGAR